MTSPITNSQPMNLWPGEVPGIHTGEPRHVPTLVPFLVDTPKPRGAVVVCPGGGYAGRADHEGEPIARMLNQAGIHAFVCHYRVASYRHPYPLMDAQRAIRTVRVNAQCWGILPDRIGILGFSAGGHLASTAGTHYDAGDPNSADPVARVSCRPDALVLCYPVISFGQFGHLGSLRNLLGENAPAELISSLSNETQVTGDTPPTFLWHTADDAGVPVENSILFASALRKCGVPFELHIYQSGRHGLGLAPEDPHVASWAKLCCEWLAGLGF